VSVIAPAAMCAVKFPPKGILSVNVVVLPLTLTLVTVAPVLPPNCRSLVETELGSTSYVQFTSN
jgi:hypothetical protein